MANIFYLRPLFQNATTEWRNAGCTTTTTSTCEYKHSHLLERATAEKKEHPVKVRAFDCKQSRFCVAVSPSIIPRNLTKYNYNAAFHVACNTCKKLWLAVCTSFLLQLEVSPTDRSGWNRSTTIYSNSCNAIHSEHICGYRAYRIRSNVSRWRLTCYIPTVYTATLCAALQCLRAALSIHDNSHHYVTLAFRVRSQSWKALVSFMICTSVRKIPLGSHLPDVQNIRGVSRNSAQLPALRHDFGAPKWKHRCITQWQ